MAEFKLVISDPKTGKSVQKEVKDDNAKRMIGAKIGDTIKGELVDMPGYEFQITGGSDYAGFPMRRDVQGSARKRITAVKGVGVNNKRHLPNPKKKGMRTMAGMRLKKTVAGNTVHAKTAQINMKVLKHGREKLFAEEAPAAEAKEAKPEAAKESDGPKDKGGTKKMSEEKKEDVEVKEPETVPEKTEEVPEKVEEVPLGGGENVDAASEAPRAEKKEEAPAEKKEETPKEEEGEAEKAMEEIEKLDEEVKKDEEEIAKESEEIEKIEKELKEGEEKKEE